jgi:ornithine carbamoyltransferase
LVATFDRHGTKTRLSIHMTFADAGAYRTAVERYGVRAGGVETLDRLAHYLSRA